MTTFSRTPSAAPRVSAPAYNAGLVVTSMIVLQVGAVLAVAELNYMSVPAIASGRMLLAAVLLLVVARPRSIVSRLRERRTLLLSTALGVALAAMHVCIYEAFARVPLGLATTLEAAGPLMLAVIRSRRRCDLVCAGLAAIGVVVAARPSLGASSGLGVAFATSAGICWAAYITLNRRCSEHLGDSLGLCAAFAIGGFALLPWAALTTAGHLPAAAHLALLPMIALLSSALPFSLESRALRHISEYLFSILTSLYPAIGALLAFLTLGQRLDVAECTGMVLVICASITALRGQRSAALTPAPARSDTSRIAQEGSD